MSELNLLPYDMRRGKQGSLDSKQLVAIGVAAAVVIGTAVAVPVVRLKSLEKTENRLQEYVQRNASILTENEELQKQIDNMTAYVALTDTVREGRVLSAEVIGNIEKYIHPQVVLKSLSYTKGTIQISATSNDYNAICIFSANVQTSEDFSGSLINSITTGNGDTGYTTNITISFGGGEAVEGTQP